MTFLSLFTARPTSASFLRTGLALFGFASLLTALPAAAQDAQPQKAQPQKAQPQKAQPQKAQTRDVVYVESNIATRNGNSIFAFHRDEDGTLTPLPGSPFASGGRGIFDTSLKLGPFDSDHEIIVNPARTLLFAVNSGSNTIAVFRIKKNGALTPVKGSPFSSDGINPVSLGLTGDILTVVNKNEDPAQLPNTALPSYSTLYVTPHGELFPLPYSIISLPTGADPTDAAVSPAGYIEFGADFLGGKLESLLVFPFGGLYQNPPQPLPASEFAGTTAPPLPLGLGVHPTLPILYVGFVTINKLGVYTYGSFGRLKFIRTVPNSGQALCWVRLNKAATRLYTSNTTTNSISVYDLKNPLKPVEIQELTLTGGDNAYQINLDPDEKFFYVVGQRATPNHTTAQSNVLHTLAVNPDGTLAEVPSSPTPLPVPDGTRSQGVIAL